MPRWGARPLLEYLHLRMALRYRCSFLLVYLTVECVYRELRAGDPRRRGLPLLVPDLSSRHAFGTWRRRLWGRSLLRRIMDALRRDHRLPLLSHPPGGLRLSRRGGSDIRGRGLHHATRRDTSRGGRDTAGGHGNPLLLWHFTLRCCGASNIGLPHATSGSHWRGAIDGGCRATPKTPLSTFIRNASAEGGGLCTARRA